MLDSIFESADFTNGSPQSRSLSKHFLLCVTRWSRPSQVNGVLQFYAIFVSQDGAEPTVVHNSSKLVEEHTLRNLTPGTAYDITVAVSLWILIFTLLS